MSCFKLWVKTLLFSSLHKFIRNDFSLFWLPSDSDAFTLLDLIVDDYRKEAKNAKRFKNPSIFERNSLTSRLPGTPKLTESSVYCLKGLPLPQAPQEHFPGWGALYTSKWFFWLSQVPANYEIPEYCNGNCNSLTAKAVHRIYEEAKYTDRQEFRIEDMYFTGFMRKKAENNATRIPVVGVAQLTGNMANARRAQATHRKARFSLIANYCYETDTSIWLSCLTWSKDHTLNRCLHLSQAQMKEDDGTPLPKELYYKEIKDWYLNGDWTQPRDTFVYGVTKTELEHGYFLDSY